MTITASQLRQDIYRLIDQVLQTGVPLEIERKGRRLRLVADPVGDKLDRLERHPEAVTGDPEDLVDVTWTHEWRP